MKIIATERELNLLIKARDEASKMFQNQEKNIGSLSSAMSSFGSVSGKSLSDLNTQISMTSGELADFKAAMQSGLQNEQWTAARDRVSEVKSELNSLSNVTEQYGPDLAATMAQTVKPMNDLRQQQRDVQTGFSDMNFNVSKFQGDASTIIGEIQKVGSEHKKVMDEMVIRDQTNQIFQNQEKSANGLNTAISNMGTSGNMSLSGLNTQIALTSTRLSDFKASMASGGVETDQAWINARDQLMAMRGELGLLTSLTAQYGPELAATMTESMKPMLSLRNKQKEIQKGFAELTFNRSKFQGDTDAFIRDIHRLGAEHKKVTDAMLANNDLAMMGIIRSVGVLMARSTQSEKIAQNYDTMNNPLYKVNNGLLAITGNFEKMAKAGMASALALKIVGPTGNMKQLQDQMNLINQGIMRYTMVSLAATIGAAMFYGALHKGAMENAAYAASWNSMITNLKAAFKPVMDVFVAIMPHVFNFIGAIAAMVAKFNEAHPTIAKVVGAFLLILPALFAILAPLAVGIGMVNGMAAAFSALWMLIGPLVVGLGAMTGTVLLVAAAIVGLATAVYLIYKNWDAIVAYFSNIWESIKSYAIQIWTAIADFFITYFEAYINLVTTVWTAIFEFYVAVWGKIFDVAKTIWNAIMDFFVWFWNAFTDILKAAWDIIVAAITWYWELISGIFKKAFDAIAPIVSGGWEIITTAFRAYIDTAVTILTAMWEIIKTVFAAAFLFVYYLVTGQWDKIGELFRTTGKKLGEIVSGAWEKIKDIWDVAFAKIRFVTLSVLGHIANLFIEAWEGIKSGVSASWELIKSTWNSGIDAVVMFTKTLWSDIKTAFFDGVENAKTKVSEVWANIKTAFNNGKENAKTTISEMWNDVVSFFTNAPGRIVAELTSLATQIMAKWTQIKTDAFEMGKNIIQGMIDGIQNMASAAAGAAMSAVKGAIDSAKGVLGIKSPSRVFMEIGEFTSEGLAIGIMRAAHMAREAAESLASSAISPFDNFGGDGTSPFSGGSADQGSGSGGVTNVYITFEERSVILPEVKDGPGFVKSLRGVSLKQAFKVQ